MCDADDSYGCRRCWQRQRHFSGKTLRVVGEVFFAKNNKDYAGSFHEEIYLAITISFVR